MKSFQVGACILACLLFATYGFGQSSNGTLSGTVSDSARALVPVRATVPGSSFYASDPGLGRGLVRFAFPKKDETFKIVEKRFEKLNN